LARAEPDWVPLQSKVTSSLWLNLSRPDSIQRLQPGLYFSAQSRSTDAAAHLLYPPKLQADSQASRQPLFLEPILQVTATNTLEIQEKIHSSKQHVLSRLQNK